MSSGKRDPDRLRRHAADNGVGRDRPGHHRTGGDHSAGADRNAGGDRGAVADPDIVADSDGVLPAPGEDLVVACFAGEVVVGAVGEMMLADAPGRVVGRVDADIGGDRAELSDRGEQHLPVFHDVAVVAEARVTDAGARSNLDISAEHALLDLGVGRDQRRRAEARGDHAAAGAKRVTSMTRSATSFRTASSWKMPRKLAPSDFASRMSSTTTARLAASSEAVGSSRRRSG